MEEKNKLESFFDELNKKLFPNGEKQQKEETQEIIKLSNGKLNSGDSFKLLLGTSALFSMTEDKSESRMIEYINKKANQKLNNEEAKAIFDFITSKFYRFYQKEKYLKHMENSATMKRKKLLAEALEEMYEQEKQKRSRLKISSQERKNASREKNVD